RALIVLQHHMVHGIGRPVIRQQAKRIVDVLLETIIELLEQRAKGISGRYRNLGGAQVGQRSSAYASFQRPHRRRGIELGKIGPYAFASPAPHQLFRPPDDIRFDLVEPDVKADIVVGTLVSRSRYVVHAVDNGDGRANAVEVVEVGQGEFV